MYSVGLVWVAEEWSPQPVALDVLRIREIARTVKGVSEISFNPTSRVISFRNTGWNCRINVYYTTGTVGTCLNHPYAGKTQLFRRGVDYKLLKTIFEDPRVHTGDGYYSRAETAAAKVSKAPPTDVTYDEAGDEETELRLQLALLQPQVDLIRAQLAALEAKRVEERTKADAQAAAQREKLRAQQELARQREAEEQLRVAEERQRAVLAVQAKKSTTERSRMVNARGNNCHYRLDYEDDFPISMADVVCVALSEGGYVAVFENGTCAYQGIHHELAAELQKQKFSNIAHIAAGPGGNFFVRKTNGRVITRASYEFQDMLNATQSAVRLVAFGEYDTFYVEFEDGFREWSENLEDWLGTEAFEFLVEESGSLETVWFGFNVETGCFGHYIGYSNGACSYAYLPRGVQEWLGEKKRRTRVKQVLADQKGGFFIRYS